MAKNEFENPLSGVPTIESPFFEELLAKKNIDAETMRIAVDLREKGFSVITFPDDNFDARAERIKRQLSPKLDLERWRRNGWERNEGLRIQDAWQNSEDVKAIASNKQLLSLLERLYGRRAFPFQTLNFPVSTQQETHSDAVHFSSIPERFMCGVWVAMEDTDENNGSLVYYPGSHKLPIFGNEHLSLSWSNMQNRTNHYTAYEKLYPQLMKKYGIQQQSFFARKGQALIWAANLLHGGGKQKDPSRTRWSQVTHYYFDNCIYYTPMMSDLGYAGLAYRSMSDVGTGIAKPHYFDRWKVGQDVLDYSENKVRAKLPSDFDPREYLEANPDVAASGMDAVSHYISYGKNEGRPIRLKSKNSGPI